MMSEGQERRFSRAHAGDPLALAAKCTKPKHPRGTQRRLDRGDGTRLNKTPWIKWKRANPTSTAVFSTAGTEELASTRNKSQEDPRRGTEGAI